MCQIRPARKRVHYRILRIVLSANATSQRIVLSAKRSGLSANRPVILEKIGTSRMLRTAVRKIKCFGDAVKKSGEKVDEGTAVIGK